MILEIASSTVTTYTVLLKNVIFNWRWPVASVFLLHIRENLIREKS